MNDPRARKRLLWLAAIGGVLLLALLFIALVAPSPGAAGTPVVRPAETTAGASATPAPEASASQPSGFSLGGGDLISLAWRLGLVALIIGGSIVGLRWWGKRTMGPKSETGFLRVVDTLAIGNGRTIHLVALGERVITIGATAHQVSFLNELTTEESDRVLALAPRGSEQSLSGFAAELFQSFRSESRPGAPSRHRASLGEDA